ncbi:MAG: hypothetical protein FJW79_04510 [Actinobacteria bacterium]|nr:hypothetical protein [Actinomycetota bacterium]
MRRAGASAVLALALLALPGTASAQEAPVSGLLVRIEGDVVVGRGESADLVLVVSGDAEVRGRAGAVVVLGGNARLIGARVGHLMVFRGTAELRGATVVEGDVWLTWARLDQRPTATVRGSVHRGVARFGWGWPVLSLPLSLGVGLVLMGASLLVAWAAPRRMAAAAAALTGSLPGAAAWAGILFVVGPGLALLAFFTVVGLPASLVALGVVLPLACLAGFAVAARRLGTWVLRSSSPRPYGAVALGCVLLLAAGLIPVAGQVGVLLASALGAGALAQTVGGGRPAVAVETAPAEDEGE